MHVAKEAYACGKRGLCIWQKGPMYMAMSADIAIENRKDAYVCALRYRAVTK